MIALRPSDVWKTLVLAAVYVLTARVGLGLDAVAGFAALVWAPTGISLAALLLGGVRLWPGVIVGAMVANLMAGAPAAVAASIAVGNTLEAVLAAYALNRIPGFSVRLDRVRDVLALIVLAAGASTLVSATIGVGSLYVAGVVARDQVGEAWRSWWIGDAIGDLLVAPVLLLWFSRKIPKPDPSRLLEASALAVTVVGLASLTFLSRTTSEPYALARAYLVFPTLIWASLRFGPRGTVSSVFVASCIAVWGTMLQRGPFVYSVLHDSLLTLQLFMGVVAVTFLVLAATIAERRRAEMAAQSAREQAERANQAKAEFLAVMSHELRTPLNAISGYVDLLIMGTQGALNPNQLDSLTRVQRNQQHLLALIEDVLSFARLEAGKLKIQPAAVRVIDAIESIDSVMQPEFRRKSLAFERRCDNTLAVRADPEKLRQILLNLFSNAAKYTEDGGLVTVTCTRDGPRVHIAIRDTGVGIPSDSLSDVFQPFFQVERGTTRRYAGIGLGLTIARDLARAMQGEVLIESTEGKGTTATVVLPSD